MSDWDQLDMLDLLTDPDTEHRRALLDARWNTDPLHRVMPRAHRVCGRCGEIYHFAMSSHDGGYTGCPVDTDPTWKRYPRRTDGLGSGHHRITGYDGGILTVADLCDRWDARWWPDCKCGHPWGVHVSVYGMAEPMPENRLWCSSYCGCDDYREVAA